MVHKCYFTGLNLHKGLLILRLIHNVSKNIKPENSVSRQFYFQPSYQCFTSIKSVLSNKKLVTGLTFFFLKIYSS